MPPTGPSRAVLPSLGKNPVFLPNLGKFSRGPIPRFAKPWQKSPVFAKPWQNPFLARTRRTRSGAPQSKGPPALAKPWQKFRRAASRGFTLIELLLALSIFSLVMAMAGGAFWSIMRSWRRGSEMLDQLHYGEYAMEQLVSAIRSAAWFPSKPVAYGFLLDDAGGTGPNAANSIEFTTSGTAFLPPDSPYRNGLHRLSVTVSGSGGERGLAIQAWPHMTEEEDLDRNAVETVVVTTEVRGFSCEWYDFEADDWAQDWEETNSLPKLLRVTLTMKPRETDPTPVQLQRVVTIPVAPDLPGQERRARSGTTGSSYSDRKQRANEEENARPPSDSSRPANNTSVSASKQPSSSSHSPSHSSSPSQSSPGHATITRQGNTITIK
jgi:prepilin-type N-terminal cleavage/methylation domain-containing protein